MKAIDYLEKKRGFTAINLGSGKGYTVLEFLKAFEKATGQQIQHDFKPPRKGDLGKYFASIARAEQELDWRPEYELDQMLRDTWNWQQRNPEGYRS